MGHRVGEKHRTSPPPKSKGSLPWILLRGIWWYHIELIFTFFYIALKSYLWKFLLYNENINNYNKYNNANWHITEGSLTALSHISVHNNLMRWELLTHICGNQSPESLNNSFTGAQLVRSMWWSWDLISHCATLVPKLHHCLRMSCILSV